jgi:hypothetical protein
VKEKGTEREADLRTLAIDEAPTHVDAIGSATYLADILGGTHALAASSGSPMTTHITG